VNLREELQAIYDQHNRLTPALVVEAARPKDHPLHPLVFDRNKSEAAKAWYLDRAHRLIQRVRVTKAEAEEESGTAGIRRYHAVRGNGPEDYVYEPIEKIASDPFLFQSLKRELERAVSQAQSKQDEFLDYVRRIAGGDQRAAA
jgi:hypothetical protein